jgi:hypothetical protein
MYKRIAFAALVAALSGCGAGNEAGTAGITSTAGHLSASAFPALSFAPATASATVPAHTARPVVLDATISRTSDFAGLSQIHVQLADESVFQEAYVTPGASDKALLALYTSEKLTPGSYKGTVSLRLCRDEACTQQFPGSPVQLPYAIEVQPAVP